jgi:hypothetical protein
MVRAGTPEKADLLAELLWGRYRALLDVEPDEAARRPRGEPAPSDSRPMILGEARTGLRNMYWAGDTALKEHVRRLFVDNEGAMPDVKDLGYPLN